MSFKVKLQSSGVEFDATTDVTLLESALLNGVVLEYSCKNGECGVCEVDVVSGKPEGKILTCQTKPESDMIIDANFFPELAKIKVKTVPAKINKIEYPIGNICKFTLRMPPSAKFDFLAGQFIDLKVDGITRSYSIASIPNTSNTIDLHLKSVVGGEMSRQIFEHATVNQLVQIEGPKGTFFFRDKSAGPIIFLATGTGFAPVKSIVEKLLSDNKFNRKIHIYWGNQSLDMFYDDLPSQWKAMHECIEYHPCVSRDVGGASIRRGYVQNCLLADNIELKNAEVYACGSLDMITSAKDVLVAAGLNKENFFSDAFVAS